MRIALICTSNKIALDGLKEIKTGKAIVPSAIPTHPRWVKPLTAKPAHTHDFKYPWDNYRRCRKCGLRQYFWQCKKKWRRPIPGEITDQFGTGIRTETTRGETFFAERADDNYKRNPPLWIHLLRAQGASV